MRKFADKEQTDKHGIQTLRPLYPLWILEGAGQQTVKRLRPLYPLWILEGAGQLEYMRV